MTLTRTDYQVVRTAIDDAFSALYLIDVTSLSNDQLEQHQKLLTAAQIAVLRMRRNDYKALNEKTKKVLDKLKSRTEKLQDDLAGLKKATAVLKIVGGALDIFTSIGKLLK